MTWLRRLLRAAWPDAVPEVDLHGLRVPEALAAVRASLDAAERAGVARLRIVCGKGKGSRGGEGVLRVAVAGWLEANGYEGSFRREMDRDGRDGALVVHLGRPPRPGGERPG
ncbi:MAG: Smr/MutS family protein [Deferrisomatales bacterium]|nr:Smr/MutS family protein [Deferrisomatales bacterium]